MYDYTDWFQLQIREQLLVGDKPQWSVDGSHVVILEPLQNCDIGVGCCVPYFCPVAPSWAKNWHVYTSDWKQFLGQSVSILVLYITAHIWKKKKKEFKLQN